MNSNPNTPVAGLVERLRSMATAEHPSMISCVDMSTREMNRCIREAASHIEQLEADKRALVEAMDEIAHASWPDVAVHPTHPELANGVKRIQAFALQALATISNPTSVKGDV